MFSEHQPMPDTGLDDLHTSFPIILLKALLIILNEWEPMEPDFSKCLFYCFGMNKYFSAN